MVVPIEPHVNERVLLVSGHDGLDSTDSSLGRHDLIKRPHVFYLLARSVGHAHQCSRGETTPELALIVNGWAARSQVDRGRVRGDARRRKHEIPLIGNVGHPSVVTKVFAACGGS